MWFAISQDSGKGAKVCEDLHNDPAKVSSKPVAMITPLMAELIAQIYCNDIGVTTLQLTNTRTLAWSSYDHRGMSCMTH